MLPPPVGKVIAKKRRKVVTEGRVIGCEGMLDQLELKEEVNVKKENVIKKKKEREDNLKAKLEGEKTKEENVIKK